MRSVLETVPPHNEDAETRVLGALFLAKKKASELFDLLEPADFYFEANGLVYAAMKRLYEQGRPIDTVLLADALGPDLAKAGGKDRLWDLSEAVPSGGLAVPYAQMVKEKSRLRRLKDLGATLIEAALADDATAEQVHADALARLGGIEPATGGSDEGAPEELGKWYFNQLGKRHDRAQQKHYHLESGVHDLDQAMTVTRGELVVVAGRPGMAKTAFSLAYAWNVAQTSPVLFYTLEMERDRLLDRLTVALTTVDGKRLERDALTDTDFSQARHVAERIMASGLNLYHGTDLSVGAVRTQAMRMAAKGAKPALVVVDYLGLMKLPKADRHDISVGKITRGFKVLAGELGCAVWLLAQLSRQVEARTDKRPILSDLKDSGNIEADADKVLLLYRDDYYAALEKRESDCAGTCDVLIAKYRNGATNDVRLTFEASRQRFGSPGYQAPPTWTDPDDAR